MTWRQYLLTSRTHVRTALLVSLAAGSLAAVPPSAVASSSAAAATSVIDLGRGEAEAINDRGQVAGVFAADDGNLHAFVWSAASGRQDIGSLGGAYLVVTAINRLGQVAGYGSTDAGAVHAFRWSASEGLRDLGTLGGDETLTTAMNNRGDVVGWSTVETGEQHAFVWTPSQGMQDLAAAAEADDINDAGQVVGSSRAEPFAKHLFLWSQSQGFRDLGKPNVAVLSTSYIFDFYPPPHINAAGQIAGSYSNYFDTYGVFRWTSQSGFQVITTTSRAHEQGRTSAISAAGSIAGEYGPPNDLHAFLWTSGAGLRDLGAASPDWHLSSPWFVNARGQVAGTVFTSLSSRGTAVRWTAAHGMRSLDGLGGVASRAWAINASGQIAGAATTSSGELHATLWTP